MSAGSGNFEGIVLAAGYSSRMNEQWKPEVLIEQVPMLYHCLNSISAICSRVIVVGGYNFGRLKELAANYQRKCGDRPEIICVMNKNFGSGMFSSVRRGLYFTDTGADGIFIVPADMPFIKKSTYKELAGYLRNSPSVDIAIPSVEIRTKGEEGIRMKKGHPVLLRGKIAGKILREEETAIFRDVIRKYKFGLLEVNDNGIVIDIDDAEDLKQAAYINLQ